MISSHAAQTSLIRLITFDLGGVMIRLADGWAGCCAEAGIPFRPFAQTEAYLEGVAQLELQISTGRITPAQYYQGVHALLDGLYTVEEVAAIYQAVIREEFPGIADTVCALQRAGYHTACLSNTCAPHWEYLTDPARYPGIGALNCHHASHLFGAAKPDPAIYRQFEAATGQPPEAILFFDDRGENVAAAQACGWHAVQILPNQPACAQILDACARHQIYCTP